jgi:hypothetical protein
MRIFLTAAMFCMAALHAQAGVVPAYDHVVVVIMENHDYSDIVGNSFAPYINNTLITGGALFTNSHGIGHPSQPNYIELFSGSTQGVTGDPNISGLGQNGQPAWPIDAPNLGEQLLHNGQTYIGYNEGLPNVGSTVDTYGASNLYSAKHNAGVNFQNGNSNQLNGNLLPANTNQPFTAFPTDFSHLPNVAFVAPNQIDDQHGVGGDTGNVLIQDGDTWLKNNIDAYAQWSSTHNSLLIVTWDENASVEPTNQIATIFYGQNVIAGQYNENINHDNVLRTIEAINGLPGIAGAAPLNPITDAFSSVPEPSSLVLAAVGVMGMIGEAIRRRRRIAKI